ncbi:type III-B CRISPR module-associated Cmr3 family protein [Roseospira navarrensis]|uniref:CRISPR-associated protein Cmr3 n=1 Tax=Roseospira navarrensis TaxID=140058 RepID=A0A7X2D476_9PROT|nr:type III-B CRISPR module-associated Cmr3 family protein [Roseospira navarrensis]MQX37566.1 hypothetical protein [Roseospira navarrensis]
MSPRDGTPFLVEPVEPVVFGPPQSGYAGEAHRIASQFPPAPRTFQGLVRTRLLLGAEPPLDLSDPAMAPTLADLVGPPAALPEGWQLTGPFPAAPDDTAAEADQPPPLSPWVPTPRFLLGRRDDRTPRPPLFARRIACGGHPVLSDLGDETATPALGRPDAGAVSPLGGWIGPANLRAALEGEAVGAAAWSPHHWCPGRPRFVRTETQPGLAIDPGTGTAQDNALYFAQALRFAAGSGLFGSLHGPLGAGLREQALTDGAVQAGRKGRLAVFRPVPALHPDWTHVTEGHHLPESVDEEGARFWLVALTPAFLPDPRRPLDRVNPGSDVTLAVDAALTGPPLTMGGFEMTSGRPRPNRLYVPAGSVWLVRLRGGTPESRAATLRALNNHHPLGDPIEAAMGFGHTLVGRGPLTTEQGS